MTFQIVKIMNLPLFGTRFDKARNGPNYQSPTTEVWQPVGQAHSIKKKAEDELQRFLSLNRESGIYYMVVEIHGKIQKA